MSIQFLNARTGAWRLCAPALATVLTACGGGNGDGAGPATPAVQSAPVTAPGVSVRGHANYAADGSASAAGKYQAAVDSYNQQGEALNGKP